MTTSIEMAHCVHGDKEQKSYTKSMVRTRSGYRPDVFGQTCKRVSLKRSDIRPNADDTIHACPICLEDMSFARNKLPSWVQCPDCKEVLHEACMRKYILQQHTDLACPVCRSRYQTASFEFDSDIWNADTLLERLMMQHDADYTAETSSDDELDVDRLLRSSNGCVQARLQE